MPLGQGAFGSVFLVEKDGAYFALKAMKKRTFNGLLNFIMTEKEVQRKIKHKFVVKLRYAFQTFDKLYLVTDYCAGGDMRALITRKGRLPEDDARIYLAEMILAIEEVHKNGIIHRDIKPDNILIDAEGHACLADFGLSKEGMFEKKLASTILGGGASYQIPEVINELQYDKSVDLYLLGLLAYEMIEGTHCFP
jgi:serine/threonine protein kinase